MALLKTSHFLLTLVFLGISQVNSNEIQCQADPPNPVTFGDNIIVTCNSTVTITSLKVTRPGSTDKSDLSIGPGHYSKQRLKRLTKSNLSYKFKIYDTDFTDSGTWKVNFQVCSQDSGCENKKTELTIKIVKHPTNVKIKPIEAHTVVKYPKILNTIETFKA